MTSPVDPIRRSAQTRRAGRGETHARRPAGETADIGASVEAAKPLPGADADEAAFNAHKMGQERRRGLRAGIEVIDTANSAYTRTEWSGRADRRAPKGSLTRTKI